MKNPTKFRNMAEGKKISDENFWKDWWYQKGREDALKDLGKYLAELLGLYDLFETKKEEG